MRREKPTETVKASSIKQYSLYEIQLNNINYWNSPTCFANSVWLTSLEESFALVAKVMKAFDLPKANGFNFCFYPPRERSRGALIIKSFDKNGKFVRDKKFSFEMKRRLTTKFSVRIYTNSSDFVTALRLGDYTSLSGDIKFMNKTVNINLEKNSVLPMAKMEVETLSSPTISIKSEIFSVNLSPRENK